MQNYNNSFFQIQNLMTQLSNYVSKVNEIIFEINNIMNQLNNNNNLNILNNNNFMGMNNQHDINNNFNNILNDSFKENIEIEKPIDIIFKGNYINSNALIQVRKSQTINELLNSYFQKIQSPNFINNYDKYFFFIYNLDNLVNKKEKKVGDILRDKCSIKVEETNLLNKKKIIFIMYNFYYIFIFKNFINFYLNKRKLKI